jgi:hypothetical protein
MMRSTAFEVETVPSLENVFLPIKRDSQLTTKDVKELFTFVVV